MSILRSTVFSALLCAAVATPGQLSATEPTVPVVGLDESGQVLEAMIPADAYRGRLRDAVASVRDSAIPVLAKQSEREGNRWRLRTVVIGIGVSAEVGIGPILKVGATPRFRLAFSNSTDPVVP